MSEKPCAFCVLIWQIYEDARKAGQVADLDLPQSREYIRRHVRTAHNVILRTEEIPV